MSGDFTPSPLGSSDSGHHTYYEGADKVRREFVFDEIEREQMKYEASSEDEFTSTPDGISDDGHPTCSEVVQIRVDNVNEIVLYLTRLTLLVIIYSQSSGETYIHGG
jgi:hypothetical protein